ncbi:hypothetical protein J5X84_39695 [Streptosporangiaceae bacterium NEAU-GS5]|nr:hypothetical protein [Streptosporangiaceae bacterium NEAU-GS5]
MSKAMRILVGLMVNILGGLAIVPAAAPPASAELNLSMTCHLRIELRTGSDGIHDDSEEKIVFGAQAVVFDDANGDNVVDDPGGQRFHQGGTGDTRYTDFTWDTHLQPCVPSSALVDGFTFEHTTRAADIEADNWDMQRVQITDMESGVVLLSTSSPDDGPVIHRFRKNDNKVWNSRERTGELDTDHDGLTDRDELLGVTGSRPPLGLPVIDRWLSDHDADPCRKTIAVEIDWLNDGNVSDRPSAAALNEARQMFSDAPKPAVPPGECPYHRWSSPPGIQLLLHEDEAIMVSPTDRMKPLDVPDAQNRTDFERYRAAHFAAYRAGTFYYTLWGWAIDNKGSTGSCCVGVGQDFMIGLGWVGGGTVRQQSVNFVHELGHALGLGHGGPSNDPNYKPNYLSVMNYRYSNTGLPDYTAWSNLVWANLMQAPTAADLASPSAAMRTWIETSSRLDYSRRRLPSLQRGALVEANGVGSPDPTVVAWWDDQVQMHIGDGSQPLDWDWSGAGVPGTPPTSPAVSVDLLAGIQVCVTADNPLAGSVPPGQPTLNNTLETTPDAGDLQPAGSTTIYSGKDGICTTGLPGKSPVAGSDTATVPPGTDFPRQRGYDDGIDGYDDWGHITFRTQRRMNLNGDEQIIAGIVGPDGQMLPGAHIDEPTWAEQQQAFAAFNRAFILDALRRKAPTDGTLVDATALTAPAIAINGVSGWLDARKTHALHLSPGTHTLSHPGSAPISFTVDAAGVVDYAPGLAGVSGRGTHTLTVTGLPIGLDATGLSYPNIGLSGLGWQNARQVQTLHVLPGAYTLVVGGVGGWPIRIGADGLIDYDDQYGTILSGKATSTLTVTGVPVTVDASDLSYPNFGLSGHGWWSTRQPQTLRLLPGSHSLVVGGIGAWPFRIGADGLIDYDDQYGTILSGKGTTTLTVTGFRVVVDATAVSYPYFGLSGQGWWGTRHPQALRLLPGPHTYVASGSSDRAQFRVTAVGLIDYDDQTATALSGRGTTTLTVIASAS